MFYVGAVFFFFFALCEISARNCKLKKKILMFKRLGLDKGVKKKSKREFIDGRK